MAQVVEITSGLRPVGTGMRTVVREGIRGELMNLKGAGGTLVSLLCRSRWLPLTPPHPHQHASSWHLPGIRDTAVN